MVENLSRFKENPKTAYLAGEFERLQKEEEEMKELAQGELGALAAEDLAQLKERKEALIAQMNGILAADKVEEEFPNEAVLEVRTGVGGEEAALFVSELTLMYQAYAAREGWQMRMLSESKTDLGGYKEAVFEIRGKDTSRRLRFETGVHRIQRLPATEKSGRIHTSAASVIVLPIRKKP